MRRPPRPPLPQAVEVVVHPDLEGQIDWAPLVAGIDAVIHLAGIAHTRGVAPERYDRVNRLATEQAAAAAARAGVGRFVFASSIRAQCGPAADHVLTERDPPAPTDDYGRSKLAAEEAVRRSGAPFTILRPVLIYGPGVKGNFATLLRAAASRWPLPVKLFANRRSLLGIANFISALDFTLSRPATAGEIYLVADPGTPPTLAELIVALGKAQGRRPLLVPVPTGLIEIPLRIVGRSDLWERLGGNLQVDPGKLIAAGWQPAHDSCAGLAVTAPATTVR